MAILFSSPTIGPVAVDLFIKENIRTELGITSEPVEDGSEVNDHAFVRPKKITLTIADRNAAATFNALVLFQESREPFDMTIGLTTVDTCLIESLDFTRERNNSHTLSGQVEIKQIIIAESNFTSNEDGTEYKNGQPGGKNSTTQAAPASSRSGDAATADRAAGTTNRGDSPTSTAEPPPPTALKAIFG